MNIEQWISDPQRDYNVGVQLLGKVTRNTHLVRVYANRSPRFAMADLVALLQKEAKSNVEAEASTVIRTKSKEVPSEVDKAKEMIHENWVKLSKIHRAMYATGESNDKESVAKRKELMKVREPLIERYNSIYEAKEGYFAGTVTIKQLREVMEGKTLEEVLYPKPSKDETPMEKMSDLQLAKKAKAAKAAINRAKNQLHYQQDTAAKKPNPMPECPKRKAIEQKLEDKQRELAAYEAELKRRGC